MNDKQGKRLVWVVQANRWQWMSSELGVMGENPINNRIRDNRKDRLSLGLVVTPSATAREREALTAAGYVCPKQIDGHELWFKGEGFQQGATSPESNMSDQKLGGQIDAWIRQGAKDLHNAIVPAFPESARSQDEPGTPLNPTMQMVNKDLGQNYDAMLDQAATRGREPEKELER